MTYVVRRFKPKLLAFITTGTFNLLSKIRAVDPPEWDRFGSRSGLATGCPRTCTPTSFATAFDRRERLCQYTVYFRFLSIFISLCCFREIRLTGYSGKSLLRQFSKSDQLSLEPISARKDFSLGLAMVCSLRDSLQG